MRILTALTVLSLPLLATLFACPPSGDGATEGEGDVEVVDGGPTEGEGDTAEGEGDVVAGEGEGDVVAGEGEGEIQGEPYTTGVAEVGVVCGAATCVDPTASCCISFNGATCGAPGSCAAGFAAEAACDGGEDCAAGNECCFANFATSCVATDTCRPAGKEICVTRDDCAIDEECCSDDALAGFGVDGGVCLPIADNCVGQFGG